MTGLTPEKASKILKDGIIKGHSLTEAQKRFFGWVMSGMKKSKGGEAEEAVKKATQKKNAQYYSKSEGFGKV